MTIDCLQPAFAGHSLRHTAPAKRPGSALAMLCGLAAVMLSCLCAAPVHAAAQAAPSATPTVTPNDVGSGSLLLKSDDLGHYVEAPRVRTDVDIDVSGPTARARVTQVFQNPTDGWVEGAYVYPLPEDSAVDTLKMVIGKRIIVGKIRKREEARAIYEKAKAAGRKASLVEQERPNIFTSSVANIGPGETVVVQIEYQQPVRQADGHYSLRVPLVVAPRYNPAPITESADVDAGSGWGKAVGDPVPDRDRITPPVLDPRTHAPVNPVTITVDLEAGFPLGPVASSTHEIVAENTGEDSRRVTLKGPAVADRDFVLTWTPAASAAPNVGLFSETVDGDAYALAYVTPPTVKDTGPRRHRAIVFVIDNSGSMSGPSMRQARASLAYALRRLQPGDRFNVIRFDDTMTELFPETVPASADNIVTARLFVGGLRASGGTEMLPPLKAALEDHHEDGGKDVRQVVFLTDGAIGNEQQLLETIGARRGRSHVFMVGIGSAPNTYLMDRAAEIGRGTFTHIGSSGEVDAQMRALFDKLQNPAVTDLSARFTGGAADVTPEHLPDLYRGEPIVLAAKLKDLTGTLKLTGKIGERPWSLTLPLAHAARGKGISRLWARRRIADAEVARTLGEITEKTADARILSLALTHHLVTRLTSLVAVDETPSRPADAPLTRADVPLDLPAGWDFDKVFGPTGQRRAGNRNEAGPSLYADIKASATPIASEPAARQVLLPQTATDAELRMLAGVALLLLSGLVMVVVRRGRKA